MHFLTKKHISRRATLQGLGVAVGLPLLDAMIPSATALAQTAATPKMRAGFFYIPHGAIMDNTPYGAEVDAWTPTGAGADFKLNTIMKPLEKYKQYVTSFANLENAHRWMLGFVKDSPQSRRYAELSDHISETLGFMQA